MKLIDFDYTYNFENEHLTSVKYTFDAHPEIASATFRTLEKILDEQFAGHLKKPSGTKSADISTSGYNYREENSFTTRGSLQFCETKSFSGVEIKQKIYFSYENNTVELAPYLHDKVMALVQERSEEVTTTLRQFDHLFSTKPSVAQYLSTKNI